MSNRQRIKKKKKKNGQPDIVMMTTFSGTFNSFRESSNRHQMPCLLTVALIRIGHYRRLRSEVYCSAADIVASVAVDMMEPRRMVPGSHSDAWRRARQKYKNASRQPMQQLTRPRPGLRDAPVARRGG